MVGGLSTLSEKGNSFSKVPIVIIAAGKGERAKSITKETPKCLFPLPFEPDGSLFYLFRQLDRFHPQKIIIVGGYRFDLLSNTLSSKLKASSPIMTVDATPDYEKGPLYSTLAAKKHLHSNEGCWLFPADTVFHPSIIQELATVKLNPSCPTLFYWKTNKEIKTHQRILSISERLGQDIVHGIIDRSSINQMRTSKDGSLDLMMPIAFLSANFLEYAEKATSLRYNTVVDALRCFIMDKFQIEAHCMAWKDNKAHPFLDLDDADAFHTLNDIKNDKN
jgi:hypothetical protein